MKHIKHLFVLAATFLLPFTASAHVRYIANDAEVAEYGGSDMQAFLEPATQTPYIIMIVVTAVVVIGLYWALSRAKFMRRWTEHMVTVSESYKTFIPWIVRLSLGIALLGAGVSGTLLSPVLPGGELLSFIQILLGFFLLAGFLVGPSAVATLALFGVALFRDPYLIGSFDMLALILALLVLDSRRPGVDDIVGIPDFTHIKALRKFLPTILRGGIGIAMTYLAIVEKILNPHLSAFVAETTKLVDVIPVSSAMWTFSAGIIELVVGLFLLFGIKTRLTAVIALLVLSLSFFYFGEDVSSHITLFGTLSAVFILGGGPLSVDQWLHRRRKK
jgi:uncharacterized membrane protein YphA (DoxX/SURF4 family)